MKKDWVTFNNVLHEYRKLDFNRVIYGKRLTLYLFALAYSLCSILPAYFIGQLFSNAVTSIPFWITFSTIVVFFFKIIHRPYIIRRGRKLRIPSQPGIFPLDYKSFVLTEMFDKLSGFGLSNEKSIVSLINRARFKAGAIQKSRLNINFLITLLIPLWSIIIAWVFKNYVDASETPVPHLYEIVKYSAMILFIIWAIYLLVNVAIREIELQPKSRLLNFADTLEDILLNKENMDTSLFENKG